MRVSVKIVEQLSYVTEVEVEKISEALQKVKNMYKDEIIILDADNSVVDVDFQVVTDEG